MVTGNTSANTSGTDQKSIDAANAQFWDVLCGSQLAKNLGVTDSSPTSLAKFDTWYMEYYPYLYRHIPFGEMRGKKVLEVGLGYGTVSQKLAQAGAIYQGLDIARGPVEMVNQRLRQSGLPGQATQGSILEAPFPDKEFDWFVAIGCLHHTGNLQRALDEAWRVLKPGGQAMVMIYYAYSYRRWAFERNTTIRYFLADKFGLKRAAPRASDKERGHYDVNEAGESAPETAFTSASEMRRLTKRWSSCKVYRENIGEESVFKNVERHKACRLAGPFVGLDIYCRLTK